MNEDIIKLLKFKQDKVAELKESYYNLKKAFEDKNIGLIEEIRLMDESCFEAKELIKGDALKEFNETGNKKLFGGIGIRESHRITYEESKAVEWAKSNMPVAIVETIDKKQFETFAKNNDLEFVEKTTSTSVTFPKEIKVE